MEKILIEQDVDYIIVTLKKFEKVINNKDHKNKLINYVLTKILGNWNLSERLLTADLINFLLKNGTNIDTINIRGDTALILAVKQKKFEVADLLLNKGSNVNLKNSKGNTALMLCIFYRNYYILDKLYALSNKIEEGKCISNERGNNISHIAYKTKNAKLMNHIKLLLKDDNLFDIYNTYENKKCEMPYHFKN